MTTPDLAAIQRRVDAATPGPWVYSVRSSERYPQIKTFSIWDTSGNRHVLDMDRSCQLQDEFTKRVEHDFDFIAHARADIPALLAKIAVDDKRFRAHTQAVSEFLSEMLAVHDPCADPSQTIPVKDACATILLAALANRQAAYDQSAKIAELEKREAEAREIMQHALVFPGSHITRLQQQSWLASSGATETQSNSSAITDVLAERKRQISDEGWTPEHDDEHDNGALIRAAICYAAPLLVIVRQMWPWDWSWWKPTDERRNLVKAAALIIAEIERLDRRLASSGATTEGSEV